ncbi:hypothetical protein F4808DRAFT_421509 [Astrocystis sublimbata]|nr:hypothetical protein F4808DRAFT_421509 [Astrocystis sublimbata]
MYYSHVGSTIRGLGTLQVRALFSLTSTPQPCWAVERGQGVGEAQIKHRTSLSRTRYGTTPENRVSMCGYLLCTDLASKPHYL